MIKDADLVVVDVSRDSLLAGDNSDFCESRLAGLIRQHNQANFIFTIQIQSHSEKEPNYYSKKLKGGLETILTKHYDIVSGNS